MSASNFLAGGGIMGTRIQTYDWSASPLGLLETWPEALRIALGIMLPCRFPAYMVWGENLTSFYNDAFRPLLGTKPEALGRAVQQVWPEVWDLIGPVVAEAFQGEASYFENLPVRIQRKGYPEETWWTASFSPIRDDTGKVCGVMSIAQETTERVLGEQRLQFLVELGNRLRFLSDPREVMGMAAQMVGQHLQASRVGYGEIDLTGECLLVEREWSRAAPLGVTGRYRLDDLGSQAIEELRAGLTIRIDDAIMDPHTAEPDIAAEFVTTGKRATIIVPLLKGGLWTASFYVHQAEPRRWHDSEVALAQEVAERTWEAVGRARAEAALKESERRYRQLSEAVPQIVRSTDADGRVDFFNSRWFAYTGERASRDYTDGWIAAIHPDDRPRILTAWEEIRRAGKTFEFEYRLRRADGVYRWHIDRAVPVHDNQGHVVRWFGTFTDIDDRKRAEEALRESEERFRQFAEHSTSVLWVLDVETMQLEYLSPSFQQVWGEAPEAAPKNFAQWAETTHPDDREAVVAALRRIRQQGEVVVREYRIMRPDGAVRWIQNTAFPIRDEHGKVVRVAGIAQDITQHSGSMVYIVDADEATRRDPALLLQGAGYQVKVFASAQPFLEVAPVLVPGCVIVDTRSNPVGQLAIPKELKVRRVGLPVIVIGDAHGDVAVGVQAMKAGAVDFLDVHYRPDQLLEAVASALASIRDIAERDQASELAKARIAALTTREREVLDGLLAGGTNKTIARDLDISPRTVEAHRARIMERLGAQSLPELVQIAVAAGLKARPQGGSGPDTA